MDYKQIISEAVLANKTQKQTALDMKIPVSLLEELIIKIWPATRGKWTRLREAHGLSPWGHMRNNKQLVPSFRFDKKPRCRNCGRSEWKDNPIPLNDEGFCLNCAAVCLTLSGIAGISK